MPGKVRIFDALRSRPFGTLNVLAARTGVSCATVERAVSALEDLRIVAEITGRKRDRY